MNKSDKLRITVDIYRNSYTIIGRESRTHVNLIASLVDEKMREIQRANTHLDTTRLAVLTAVNTMNDYVKLKEKYNALQNSMDKKEEK